MEMSDKIFELAQTPYYEQLNAGNVFTAQIIKEDVLGITQAV